MSEPNKIVDLLTMEERAALPMVITRRNKFKTMIKSSVVNYDKLFSNCLMIQGKAGTGKTTLCETFLEQLTSEGTIAGVKRVPGHITPKSMFGVLEQTAKPDENGKPWVLLLDDVDCLGDEGCLDLMKAAFDTRSDTPTNRNVFFMNEKAGKTGIKYNGFGIIICNNDFAAKKPTVHQEALLDRVQQLSIDLQPKDMMIFSTYLLEDYLNTNPDNLSDSEIDSIVEMFNTDFRRWMDADAFRKARINYSIRLVKKFVDSQRVYGDDWKSFNITYQKLESAYQLSQAEAGAIVDPDEMTRPISPKAVLVKKSSKPVQSRSVKEPKKNRKGRYVDENGVEYSSSMQYYYRKKFGHVGEKTRKSA